MVDTSRTSGAGAPRAAWLFRKLRVYQYVVDSAIAVAFFLYSLGLPSVAPARLVDVTAMAATLVFRRMSPALALALAWLAVALQLVGFGDAPNVSNAAIFAVLYACARYGTKWVRRAALASVFVGALIGAIDLAIRGGDQLGLTARYGGGSVLGFFIYLVILVVLLGVWWVVGLVVYNRSTLEASRAAEQLALTEAAMSRREMIIAQERNQIAREMHDIVAHSLTVVIAQADGATFALYKNPDAVAEALSTIGSTARTALSDVALLLEQLRHSESVGPQPGVDDLDALFEQMRAAGLIIEATIVGDRIPLGTVQELAAYRITQEALTNALRHGDTAHPVTVRMRWSAGELELMVHNRVPAKPDPNAVHGGHGLAGMSERAALVAGFVDTTMTGSTYSVRAVIPASVSTGTLALGQ
jgi:signal transduction histidine kinase